MNAIHIDAFVEHPMDRTTPAFPLRGMFTFADA